MGCYVESRKILLSKVLVCQAGVVVGDLKRVVGIAACRNTALKDIGICWDLVNGKAVASNVRGHDLHVAAVNLAIVEFYVYSSRTGCAVYL